MLDLGDCVPGVLAVARRAQVMAEQVRAGAAMVRAADDDAWRGSAARAARATQHDVAARLDRCAEGFEEVAAAAVAHARTAGRRVEELEELARRARDLLADAAVALT